MTYALDPELVPALPYLPVIDPRDAPALRARAAARLAQLPPPDTTGVLIEDRHVPGRNGAPEVPLRIYRPEQRSGAGAVYDVHGGGFVAGTLDMTHACNLEFARELGVVVVSVDYRLAPETPFPGPLDDVYAGLRWTAENAEELGVDPQQIVLHGGSAGANLCASLALTARDLGGPDIAFQFLAVPAVDDRLTSTSARTFTESPVLSSATLPSVWEAYLGPGRRGSDDVSPYAAPARATDLTGLPPAYVSVMQFDPLRDEGIAYALALQAAGVAVELHLFPGTFHGSSMVPTAAVSQRERTEEMAVLRAVFTRLTASTATAAGGS